MKRTPLVVPLTVRRDRAPLSIMLVFNRILTERDLHEIYYGIDKAIEAINQGRMPSVEENAAKDNS